jgi:hypothetical protein
MRLIDRPVVRVRSDLIEDLACYSKACAPPPVGTGGSGDGGGGSAPSGEWRPNVSRSTPGADRVPRDTGEVMKKAYAQDMLTSDERGNDHSLSVIYEARGFHKKAEEMDTEDFEEFIKGDDVIEMWRGVDPGRRLDANIGLSYHENEYHWTGRGMFGNGTYFAAHDGSTDYAAMDARREAISYGGTDAVLIRAAMRDDNLGRYEDIVGISLAISKITTPSMDDPRKPAEVVRDLDPEGLMAIASQGRMAGAWEQYATRQTTAMAMEIVSQGLDAGMTLAQIRRVTDDHGRIAALVGYDGIRSHAYGGNAAVYTVVLNRGATVVEENLYRPTRRDATGEVPGARVKPDRDWNARRGELSSLQASAEELACYDASCRPPTSGGTGGSSKKIGGTIGLKPSGAIPKDAGEVMFALARGQGMRDYDEQQMQRDLYEARGYNARGTVISREEFNDAVDEGKFEEGWRGLDGPRADPVERIMNPAEYSKRERVQARDIIDGETHYPGRGIVGNGTYVALGPNTADARRVATGYGDNLIRIGLPKSITRNTHEEVNEVGRYVEDIINDGLTAAHREPRWGGSGDGRHSQRLHDAAYATAKNLVKAGRDAGLGDDEIFMAMGDDGRVATVLGMDGYVERKSGGDVKYVVALNRGAMTFDSTVYDHTGINPRHKP